MVITQVSQADCNKEVQDCKDKCQVIIKAADRVIQDLKDEINVRKQLEDRQQQQIADSLTLINEKDQQLQSPFRNPVLMVLSGIVLGVVTISLLRK